MRILQMISKNDKYGAQRIFIDQVQALKRCSNDVVVAGKGYEGYVPDSIKGLDIPYFGISMKGLKDILFLKAIIHRYNIDIIHTTLDRADFLGLILSKITKRPVISTNMVPRYLSAFRLMNRVIVLSEKQKSILEKRGINPEKIRIIRPGIDLDRFSHIDKQTQGQWRDRLNISRYSIVFCHISSLIPRKAHLTSLLVIAECKKRGENPLLIIIGDPLCGEYYEAINTKITEYGLKDNVCFTGWTYDIPEILSVSHFTILPSENEALGVVLIEGMAAGTPIIAREGEGGAELIEGYSTGLIFKPARGIGPLADDIISLFHSNSEFTNLCKRCREVALSEFSIPRFGERLIEVYKDMVRRDLK